MEPISTAMRAPRRGPMPGKLRKIAASGRPKKTVFDLFLQLVPTRQHGSQLHRQLADQSGGGRRAADRHGLRYGGLMELLGKRQESEWCQLRFNPLRSFATPRSIGAQIRPDPRVVADDVWAKFL